ncbi:MAG TPA: type IV pilus biogenesis protein PilM [Noviherbaspirillum sp.]|nr:type IV pilus biogenesis protein PilM [Noviherbaspirillum sp.]
MWIIWIATAMISLTGFYSVANQVRSPVSVTTNSAALAASMAIYRTAVVTYLQANPGFLGPRVSDANVDLTLRSRYPRNPIWTNYIAPDQTIYIYASTLPPVDIAADIAGLSKNSILAGRANTTTNRLESAVFPNTTQSLLLPNIPPLAAPPIPNGSPVWLAYRN